MHSSISRNGLIVAAALTLATPVAAHEGWGIAVDPNGQVYFADIPANAVWRISADGEVKRVADKHSHALVLDSDGNLYGSNPHLTLPIRSVWRLAPDGRLTDLIPPTENLPLGLQSFTMDAAGNIYSASAWHARTPEILLLQRSPDGRVFRLAGSTVGHVDGTGSQAKFLGIDGMAWGPDGLLYVADGPWVRRVDAAGTVRTLGAGPLTERRWDEDLLGVIVDSTGNVYAADHSNRRVLRIAPGGEVTTVLRTGAIWAPTGIAVAPGGLYVLEHLRMPLAILGDVAVGPYVRVRRVSPDGSATELARLWGRRSVTAAGVAAAFIGVTVWAARSRRRSRARRVST
ncbi:MAG TPA: SMP-30/gluconolactonase/LRE family protein [Thermoanaerobaculia bacterium]|nr:SMP-30/gluconolactonase/LRE family protein [Thermoanaerobaculia bacterium]